eukprot:2818083-Pleurochrysis_carterae.AAC.1
MLVCLSASVAYVLLFVAVDIQKIWNQTYEDAMRTIDGRWCALVRPEIRIGSFQKVSKLVAEPKQFRTGLYCNHATLRSMMLCEAAGARSAQPIWCLWPLMKCPQKEELHSAYAYGAPAGGLPVTVRVVGRGGRRMHANELLLLGKAVVLYHNTKA